MFQRQSRLQEAMILKLLAPLGLDSTTIRRVSVLSIFLQPNTCDSICSTFREIANQIFFQQNFGREHTKFAYGYCSAFKISIIKNYIKHFNITWEMRVQQFAGWAFKAAGSAIVVFGRRQWRSLSSTWISQKHTGNAEQRYQSRSLWGKLRTALESLIGTQYTNCQFHAPKSPLWVLSWLFQWHLSELLCKTIYEAVPLPLFEWRDNLTVCAEENICW